MINYGGFIRGGASIRSTTRRPMNYTTLFRYDVRRGRLLGFRTSSLPFKTVGDKEKRRRESTAALDRGGPGLVTRTVLQSADQEQVHQGNSRGRPGLATRTVPALTRTVLTEPGPCRTRGFSAWGARSITYVREASTTSELLQRNDVDAVEIHTSGRQSHMFKELWNSLVDSIGDMKLIAVSLPDVGESTVSLMNTMYSIMQPHLQCYNLWQLDGRPMSGDIGRGATREAIKFATRLAASKDRPIGFLQLAGGTNFHTVDGLKKLGLFQTTSLLEKCRGEAFETKPFDSPPALIGGVAYGGYARKIVGKVLHKMQSQHSPTHVEEHPDYLLEALIEALGLVGTVKCYNLSYQMQQ